MSILPLNWEDKINSAELLAILEHFGNEYYLSAEEINQFRDAINHLYNLVGGGSGITNDTGFAFDETNLVFNALFGWIFKGEDYVLDESLSIPVPYTAAGKHRTDVIVARGDTLVRLPGTEYNVDVPAPAPTFNILEDLYITDFEVNEDGYGSLIGAISGDNYIKKIYYQPIYYNSTGTDKVIPLDPLGRREIVLTNENLESIKGFDLSLISSDPSAEQPVLGFDLRIRNMTGRDVTLNHNDADTGVIVFLAKNGDDVVIPNGEFIDLRKELGNYYEGLKSWSDVELVDASESQSGIVNTTTQSFAGNKSFKGESSITGDVLLLKNSSDENVVEFSNDKKLKMYDNSYIILNRNNSTDPNDSPRIRFQGNNIIAQDIYANQGNIYFTGGVVISGSLQLSRFSFGNYEGSKTVPNIYASNGMKGGIYFNKGGVPGFNMDVGISTNEGNVPASQRFLVKNNGTIIIGESTTADPSTILSVDSTTQGSLPFPRMTEAEKNAISTPAIGLHIYQTDGTEGVYVYKSSGWTFAY